MSTSTPEPIASADVPGAELILADALAFDWGGRHFDVVLGNPPFLSQLSASTTRGGASHHGGGPYADAAAEFLSLAIRLAEPGDGRVGLVLPQSILASRDAGPVRADATASGSMCWSWWSPHHVFDAQVLVCALGFRIDGPGRAGAVSTPVGSDATWSHVVTGELGIPQLPSLATDGTVGDRARCSLNFRDEYYGLVPAVSDAGSGPPLVTSGLIDPGRCHWGERPVRFAKRTFSAPRVDVARLDARMRAWARRKLVPKVLVANQTRIVEAVADPCGAWLPGVPVSSLVPTADTTVWELAAVLTSPVAAAAAWHAAAGTGLSARAIRLGPAALASLPWPAGDLGPAAQLLPRRRRARVWPRRRRGLRLRHHGTATMRCSSGGRRPSTAQRLPEAGRQPLPARRAGDHPQQHQPDQLAEVHGLGERRAHPSVMSNTALRSVVATSATANGSIPNARCGRHAAYAMPNDKRQTERTEVPRDVRRGAGRVAEHERLHALRGDHHAPPTPAPVAASHRVPSRGGRARSSTRAVRSGSGSTPRSRTARVSAETRSAYARQSGHPSR